MSTRSHTLAGPGDDMFNPATGFPMAGAEFGVDVAGNPFGTDLHAFDVMDALLFDEADLFHPVDAGET